MTLHRKKPVLVEATQWFKNGDHPFDNSCPISPTNPDLAEGEVVRYYRTPDLDGETPCKHCSVIMHYHGWIDTLEGGHIVCPGDYIITGVQGERYPCKPDIFVATYDFWNEDSQSYEDREPCPTPEDLKDEFVPCELPPEGWTCSRGGGHEGPCAASPTYGSHGQRKPYEKPAITASASVAEVAKDLAGCKSAYEPHDGELTEEDHGE